MAALDYDHSNYNVHSYGSAQRITITEFYSHSLTAPKTYSTKKELRFPVSVEHKTASLPSRMYSAEYAQLYSEAPWVADFLSSSHQLNDVKSLLPYYKKINELLINEKYDTCNNFINQVRISNLSDVLLVGLLRLTNSWQENLPAWNKLLKNSKNELKNRGKDPAISLKGLI